MKFNTNILFFPSKHASYVRKLCLCGKERKSPRKLWSAGEKNKKRRKRSGLNFRIFSIRRCSLLEKKTEKRLLIFRINSADRNIQTDESSVSPRAAGLLQNWLQLQAFTQATTMQILFWASRPLGSVRDYSGGK